MIGEIDNKMNENNLKDMIALYEEKMKGLDFNSDKYILYQGEINKLKAQEAEISRLQEASKIEEMIGLYQEKILNANTPTEKCEFYEGEIKRLTCILEQIEDDRNQSQTR